MYDRSGMPIDVTRHAEPWTAVAVVLRCIKTKNLPDGGFFVGKGQIG